MSTTLSVQPTANNTPYTPYTPYTHVNQVIRDYYAGKPVLVRGYNQLSGLTIDCYEAATLRSLGYTSIEFRLGPQSKEVAL